MGSAPQQAEEGGMNPRMFTSFLDGTKPAIESTAVANVDRACAGSRTV